MSIREIHFPIGDFNVRKILLAFISTLFTIISVNRSLRP
jgi:hypothetical protein